MYEAASEDLDDVIKSIPDGPSKTEALELKQRISKQNVKKPAEAKTAAAEQSSAGFKRMEIVEASDSDSDEAAPKQAAKPASPKELLPEIKVEISKQGIEK